MTVYYINENFEIRTVNASFHSAAKIESEGIGQEFWVNIRERHIIIAIYEPNEKRYRPLSEVKTVLNDSEALLYNSNGIHNGIFLEKGLEFNPPGTRTLPLPVVLNLFNWVNFEYTYSTGVGFTKFAAHNRSHYPLILDVIFGNSSDYLYMEPQSSSPFTADQVADPYFFVSIVFDGEMWLYYTELTANPFDMSGGTNFQQWFNNVGDEAKATDFVGSTFIGRDITGWGSQDNANDQKLPISFNDIKEMAKGNPLL
jgi:hypothetical protein